ncbi:MAG: AAA family ATPase, partial [Chlorobi bacterium]|nr:AAA family ATPase [Chlorobiota bacterium]
IQQTIQDKIVAIERAKKHAEETDIRQAELKEEVTGLEERIEVVRTETEAEEKRVQSIEAELENKTNEIVALEKTLKEERARHDDSISRVHDIEMKCEEIRQRIVSMKERAQEDFGIDLDSVEVGDDNVFDLAQARDEINTLKHRIKNLGPINQLAYEEYKQEKERLDTLVAQREDLLEARTTLYQTIDEINRTAREKFLETFEKIRSNFISLFKKLFDEGDEADLVLEEGADPLEARIEIIAKPRGKRPHSIEMLSQGEKTLTATALLFAIYLVKPSPFCILDEVDAPLDDANIERFLKILREFSTSTQFIVVTHNKKTMSECDTLYGVTMEEEGVSKMVGVDFKKNGVPAFSEN